MKLDPDGTSETTDYTCCSLPGVVTDRSGKKTYYDYDALKRLVRVQDADGQTLQMDYDADDNRTGLLDAQGRWTRWGYDGQGRMTGKRYADGKQESVSYNGSTGQVASTTNARSATTNYTYDAMGQLKLIDYPNAVKWNGADWQIDVSYSYDALGRRASMTDAIGTTSWSYDGVGRLTGESGPLPNSGLNYSYDAMERLKSVSVARDANSSDITGYKYDGLGRLSLLTGSAGGAAGFGEVGEFSYSYLGTTGMLDRMNLPNGTKAQYLYEGQNSLKRLVGVSNVLPNGTDVSSSFSYAYSDANFRDNRSSVSKTYGAEAEQTSSYGYSTTSMLTGESAAAGGSSTPELNKSYSFDAMGNRTSWNDGIAKTSQSASYNGLNQLTAVSSYSTATGTAALTGTQSFGYDPDGSLGAVVSPTFARTESGR